MNIAALGADNRDALLEFFGQLSEWALTSIKENVCDLEAGGGGSAPPVQRWVALDGGDVTGYVAVRQLPQRSEHLDEMRLVVHPARRRAGVGRALACHALAEAVRAGRRKLVVEIAADEEHALAMSGSLGFTGEALLRDHLRDVNGELHGLVMLAHYVDGTSACMETAGVT